LLTACLAAAAAIDGTWLADVKGRAPKKAGGGEVITHVQMNLKADGMIPTGTVSGAGKRGAAMKIVDGKIDGNSFSFTTVQTTKKGETRLVWQGTVSGDTMSGTRTRNGAKHGQSFTAKRG
jgi:hypothetical protein